MVSLFLQHGFWIFFLHLFSYLFSSHIGHGRKRLLEQNILIRWNSSQTHCSVSLLIYARLFQFLCFYTCFHDIRCQNTIGLQHPMFFRPLRFDIHMGALWKRPACMRIKYKHEYFVYFYDLIIHFIWSILNILRDKFLLSSNTIRTYIWWHMMGLQKIIQNRCILWGTHLCQAYMYITLLKLVFSLKHPLKH